MKLLDEVRQKIRMKHYSYSTEKTYVSWIKRYILFHNKRHPNDMGETEIAEFLSYLATKRNVAASTQNQALNSIIFLYKYVLKKPLNETINFCRAKKPMHLPTVLTRAEICTIFQFLEHPIDNLMLNLIYGTGMRLSECNNLRIKDIDFDQNQILIRDAKGFNDRLTMLPQKLKNSLKIQVNQVKVIHQRDLKNGYGSVYLPYALEKKYPNAGKKFAWQFIFPSNSMFKCTQASFVVAA